jgi:hypothetical protein
MPSSEPLRESSAQKTRRVLDLSSVSKEIRNEFGDLGSKSGVSGTKKKKEKTCAWSSGKFGEGPPGEECMQCTNCKGWYYN